MVNYCKSSKCLLGKTAIITGANAGIGYQTALDFAKRGARVIMACRNQEKALEARQQIVDATQNENIIVKTLDLESLSSVRDFAKDIDETEERLDLLINNGGAYLPEKITKDGLQAEMQVNYFSHFLLTMLLLDLLKKSAPSRIINVSSNLAKFIRKLNLDDLNKYGSEKGYYLSKLCQICFTQELARRLKGTGVTVYSVHPGAVHTQLQSFSTVLDWVASIMFKTPEEGTQTTLHAALEDGIEEDSGEHFEDCKKVSPYCGAKDADKAKKLWEMSEEAVGFTHL